jgi:1-acyl-sn-glycerol-3-phosphate acyltransferase
MNPTLQKPRSKQIHPEITFLPPLTRPRRIARCILRALIRLLVRLFTNLKVSGLDNTRLEGAALVVANHLGDGDLLVGVAISPRFLEVVAKAELRSFPILGWLMRLYGVIWVHRGRPDRRALKAVMQSLEQGRPVVLSPEGRESLTGALEEGTHGAAYLALKTGVPVLPVTITGTENWRLYGNMKRLLRTLVTVTIGAPFHLESTGERRTDLERGTQTIMQALASLLPAEYGGVYQTK